MVLESLVNPSKAQGRPWVMIALGAIYASVAIALGMWIFYSYSSLIFVFFAAIACIPLMIATIKNEEEKDLQDMGEVWLLKEHGRALSVFMYLFIGITLASVLWYVVLPSSTVGTLFEAQLNTYKTINPGVATGAFASPMTAFSDILLNNLKVMIFCAIFSFIYGAGAIFILSWNASVIGVAMGNFIRGNIAQSAHLIGFEKFAQYMQVIGIGLFKYVIHGIPEILAYFVAGLAGGIISIAVIRHDFGTRKFEHILLDSADLFLLAIGLLVAAAALEVWVTPMIF